jgi:hypothetical protein
MLYPISFQSGGPYAFAAVSGATEYQVVIRDTDDIVCTVTKLLQDAVLYTPQDPTPEQQAQARQNLGLDELPTGGGSNYRLIYKIVIDETNRTGAILITEDMDGKPLELTQLFIYADWTAHESRRADAHLSLNNTKFPWIFCVETTPYKYTVHAEAFDGVCYFNFDAKITDGKGTSRATYVNDISGATINRILWSTGTSTQLPVGSTFTVYGY